MLTQLKDHLKNRESQRVIDLITAHPELLDAVDENGVTGLLLVAYGNDRDMLAKAKSLKKTFNFCEAIVCGVLEKVKSYLRENPDLLHQHSPDGFTPVALAAFFEQPILAEYLLVMGADPNVAATNPSRVNALHAAVARGQVELCRTLIRYGADVNARQNQKVTPLHSAVHQNNLPLVRLLVENGADIHLKMDNGDDALSMAERDGFAEILNYLRAI